MLVKCKMGGGKNNKITRGESRLWDRALLANKERALTNQLMANAFLKRKRQIVKLKSAMQWELFLPCQNSPRYNSLSPLPAIGIRITGTKRRTDALEIS